MCSWRANLYWKPGGLMTQDYFIPFPEPRSCGRYPEIGILINVSSAILICPLLLVQLIFCQECNCFIKKDPLELMAGHSARSQVIIICKCLFTELPPGRSYNLFTVASSAPTKCSLNSKWMNDNWILSFSNPTIHYEVPTAIRRSLK